MAEMHEGGCLCGAVRYRVTAEPDLAGVCHCTFCKKRTGSAFGVAAYFDESAVQIKGGALKTYEYRSDENNRWLKLEFCRPAGRLSHGQPKASPAHGELPSEHLMIPTGSSLRRTFGRARRCIGWPFRLRSPSSKPALKSMWPAL
jgi:hypothetical protein